MRTEPLLTLTLCGLLVACGDQQPEAGSAPAVQPSAPRGAPLRAALPSSETAGGAAQAAIAAADALPPFAAEIAAKREASGGDFDYTEYTTLPFQRLREMDYDLAPELPSPLAPRPQQIPEELLALNGKKIAIEGFMQPLDFDKGGVKSFALVGDQLACCFAMMPKMNEWLDVAMQGDLRAGFYSYDPITVYGVLDVGEKIEDGYVVSLFRLSAQRVDSTY